MEHRVMEELDSPSSLKMNCLKLQSDLFADGSNFTTPSDELNSILYVHPSTMTALSSAKGCCALVSTSRGYIIMKLFSHNAVKAQCAVFQSSVFKYYESSTISILPLNSLAEAAKEIYLYPEIYRNFMISPEFQAYVAKKIRHIYIREGLIVNINYLGYSCFFTIKHITPNIVETIATEKLEQQCTTTNYSEVMAGVDLGFDAIQTSTPISSRKDSARSFRGEKKETCEEKFYFLHSLSKVIIKKSKPETCISFKDIVALDEVIMFIKLSISSLLNSDYGPVNVFPKGILLIGSSGSGKSMISKALKSEYSIPVHIVECQNIKG